jgi:hypothetical protein
MKHTYAYKFSDGIKCIFHFLVEDMRFFMLYLVLILISNSKKTEQL